MQRCVNNGLNLTNLSMYFYLFAVHRPGQYGVQLHRGRNRGLGWEQHLWHQSDRRHWQIDRRLRCPRRYSEQRPRAVFQTADGQTDGDRPAGEDRTPDRLTDWDGGGQTERRWKRGPLWDEAWASSTEHQAQPDCHEAETSAGEFRYCNLDCKWSCITVFSDWSGSVWSIELINHMFIPQNTDR